MNQLMPEEVHAVIHALSDLYVQGGKGHGDLNMTLEHESEGESGRVKATTGFHVTHDAKSVTLGVGFPNVRHVRIPFLGVVRIIIER